MARLCWKGSEVSKLGCQVCDNPFRVVWPYKRCLQAGDLGSGARKPELSPHEFHLPAHGSQEEDDAGPLSPKRWDGRTQQPASTPFSLSDTQRCPTPRTHRHKPLPICPARHLRRLHAQPRHLAGCADDQRECLKANKYHGPPQHPHLPPKRRAHAAETLSATQERCPSLRPPEERPRALTTTQRIPNPLFLWVATART